MNRNHGKQAIYRSEDEIREIQAKRRAGPEPAPDCCIYLAAAIVAAAVALYGPVLWPVVVATASDLAQRALL